VIQSSADTFDLLTSQNGSAAPYDSFLPGLRIWQSIGPRMLRKTGDSWLELTGSASNPAHYIKFFSFSIENDHHHPECFSIKNYIGQGFMNLIIEADSTWEESE
jgi:hypothetical protein